MLFHSHQTSVLHCSSEKQEVATSYGVKWTHPNFIWNPEAKIDNFVSYDTLAYQFQRLSDFYTTSNNLRLYSSWGSHVIIDLPGMYILHIEIVF